MFIRESLQKLVSDSYFTQNLKDLKYLINLPQNIGSISKPATQPAIHKQSGKKESIKTKQKIVELLQNTNNTFTLNNDISKQNTTDMTQQNTIMYSSFAQLSEETKQKLISRHGENIMEE
jgi:hypothetical protein